MMFSKKAKKGFTLIEMLIVIVIIGILAAALIPRLTSARGRASDVARKAALQQISTALVSYQIDHGFFPTTGGALKGIEPELIAGGLSSVPKDPNMARAFSGVLSGVTEGEFAYTPITKNGLQNNGFVLMAGTETEGGSNRVYESGSNITGGTDYASIILCKTLTASLTGTAINSGDCTYKKTDDVLRYIAIY